MEKVVTRVKYFSVSVFLEFSAKKEKNSFAKLVYCLILLNSAIADDVKS